MPTMKAIVMQGNKSASLVSDRPTPSLRPGYLLVTVKAVALNPTDFKHIDFMNTPGHLSGCDYAGIVAEIGSDVHKEWKVGDRICGFAHGGNSLQKEDGAFAEVIAVKADIQLRIPEGMGMEEAATLGVGVLTCGQGLYQQMGMGWPGENKGNAEVILIYGGSSATGTLGIQFAKMSGYTVITTCSPRNFELVKSLGATAAFDYKDPNCVKDIKEFTKDNLKLVWDTISLESSAKLCADVIASGGTYGTILTVNLARDDVKQTSSLGYTAVGERIEKRSTVFTAEQNAKDFDFMVKWSKAAEKLLADGKIKPHPSKVDQGLEKVLDGVDMLRNDKVSGQKLVYRLSE